MKKKKNINIKNKKLTFICLFLIILIVIIMIIVKINKKNKVSDNNSTNSSEKFVTISESGTKTNISSKIQETKIVEGLEFSNLKITMKNNQTFITGKVSNPTKNSIKGFYFKITALNENGETISETEGLLDSIISAGSSINLETITSKDFANCYDIQITKIKDAD